MNKNLVKYIDLLFLLFLIPLLIILLPIDRWLDDNIDFVIMLIFWSFFTYAVHRFITLPLLFSSKRTFVIISLLITLLSTHYVANYQLERNLFPNNFPKREIIKHNSLSPKNNYQRKNFESDKNIKEAIINNQLVKKLRGTRSDMHKKTVWFVYLLITCFSMVVGLLNELTKQIMLRNAIEFEKNKAELALYKAQINPHFLFNTLNTIYSLIVTQSEKAEKAFMQFTNLIKYMYSNGIKDSVSVDDEINYIQDYVNLQKHRLNNHTKVDFKYNTNNKIGNINIAPMLMITFVENAFKYGVSSNKDTIIEIDIEIKDKKLEMICKNDILNLNHQSKETSPKEQVGTGINNCRKRLALLYPDKHQLEIIDNNTNFIVNLMINLKSNNNLSERSNSM